MQDRALALFLNSVEKDPVFAAEGLDLEAAQNALEALEVQCRDLAAAFADGSWLRRLFLFIYPLETYALPTPFLRAFIECERERRAFLEAPMRENAERLIGAWHKAHQELVRCLAQYRTFHTLLQRFEKAKNDATLEDIFGNRFTLREVYATLDLLDENARELGRAIERREGLLQGAEMAEKDILPDSNMLGECSPKEVPAQFAAIIEHERANISRRGKIVETHGPVCYALPHFDGKQTEHLFCAYIVEEPVSRRRELQVMLADDFFFLDLQQKTSFAHWAKETYEPLPSMGVPYWCQAATNFYSSRDQRYWADLATLVDLKRRPHLNAALVRAQRSSLLDMLFNMCATDLRWYGTIIRKRARSKILRGYAAFNFGLVMRSNPSLFYLPFNKSVWRLAQQPNFLGISFDGSKSPYLRAKDVLPKLSAEQLALVMQGGAIRAQAWKKEEAELNAAT